MLTIGVIFSSCRSISPCSKNSDVTRSATRFSMGHGFVIADKSHTVMLIALNNERGSSLNQFAIEPGFTNCKNDPRFLKRKMSKNQKKIFQNSLDWPNGLLAHLKYTAKSVDKIASSSTRITRLYSSDDRFERI